MDESFTKALGTVSHGLRLLAQKFTLCFGPLERVFAASQPVTKLSRIPHGLFEECCRVLPNAGGLMAKRISRLAHRSQRPIQRANSLL
jgi:hypothetical protein